MNDELIKLLESHIEYYISIYPSLVLQTINKLNFQSNMLFLRFIIKCIINNPFNIRLIKNLYGFYCSINFDKSNLDDSWKVLVAFQYLDDKIFIDEVLRRTYIQQYHFYHFKNKMKLIQEFFIDAILKGNKCIPFGILEKQQWMFIKLKRFS